MVGWLAEVGVGEGEDDGLRGVVLDALEDGGDLLGAGEVGGIDELGWSGIAESEVELWRGFVEEGVAGVSVGEEPLVLGDEGWVGDGGWTGG